MKHRKDDKLKDLEDKLKDQVGIAKPESPASDAGIERGNGVTVNNYGGGNVTVINYNIQTYRQGAAQVMANSFNYIIVSPLAEWLETAQNRPKKYRRILRKKSPVMLIFRQKSRKPKTARPAPQPQSSRHFQPNPPTSPIPPNIPLLHKIFCNLAPNALARYRTI